MDGWADAALTLNLLFKYGPQVIALAHSITHDLMAHPDANVRHEAEKVHAAMHGEPQGPS
jgi:hypothetical protein